MGPIGQTDIYSGNIIMSKSSKQRWQQPLCIESCRKMHKAFIGTFNKQNTNANCSVNEHFKQYVFMMVRKPGWHPMVENRSLWQNIGGEKNILKNCSLTDLKQTLGLMIDH